MHRHGTLVFRAPHALSTVRHASTAAKLKPREWDGTDTTLCSYPAQLRGDAASMPSNTNTIRSNPPNAHGLSGPNPSRPTASFTPPQEKTTSFSANPPIRKGFRRPEGPSFGSLAREAASTFAARSTFDARNKSSRPYKARMEDDPLSKKQFQPRPAGSRIIGAGLGAASDPRQWKQEAKNFGKEGAVSSQNMSQQIIPRPRNQDSRSNGSEKQPSSQGYPVHQPIQAMEENGLRSSRNRRDKFKERGSLLEPGKIHDYNTSYRNARIGSADMMKKPKVVKPRTKPQRRAVEVFIPSTVSVSTLARILKVKIERLQQKMEAVGITERATHDYVLTADYAALLAEEFGRKPIIDDEKAFDLFPPLAHPDATSLPLRPPIVTIMGHVDHGKTTLLDTLRSSSVAKGEAGGITQHIGAFSVPAKAPESSQTDSPQSITFLDTPGHAAFSAMRARGAIVTDIIVLVVAADDGIMPQTREVIDLYKKYEESVALVVAINKIDKPAADVESVEKALMAEGIQLESYGGDIPAVHVSGLTGQGLPDLLETLSAVAEMQDLRAEQEGSAFGEILESEVKQGLGLIGTVLVTRGALKTGSHIISGSNYAKVRCMMDSNGAVVKVATPGMAVTVSGWKTLPKAGDNVIESSESDVKKALANRIRKVGIEASLADVDAINESRRIGREQRLSETQTQQSNSHNFDEIDTESDVKELKLIIKADVSGSAEAVEGALQGIGNKTAKSRIISTGVGDISESDVMLAKAANATIVGFSVSVSRSIQNLANQNGVPLCTSNIIYKLMDDVRERVRALLPVIVETKVVGEANVLQLFDIQLKDKTTKKVAGCRVTNGLVERSKFARIVRDGQIIHEGTLDTMRHLKKDVTEVRKGTECGLSFANFSDIREGDLIQMFDKIEKLPML